MRSNLNGRPESVTVNEEQKSVRFETGHGLDKTLPLEFVEALADEQGTVLVVDSEGLTAEFDVSKLVQVKA